jgi:hypothetical protein
MAEEQSESSDGLSPAAGGMVERAGGGRPSAPDGAEGQLRRSELREVRAKAEAKAGGSSPTAAAAVLCPG